MTENALRRVPVYVSDPAEDEANRLAPVGEVDRYVPQPLYSPDGALISENRLAEPAPPEAQGALSHIANRLLGTQFGEERYQLWPEKMVRSGVSLARDVAEGRVLSSPGLRRKDVTDVPPPQLPTADSTFIARLVGWAPVAAQPQDQLLERTQDMAGLAMTGGLAGVGSGGKVLGSGPVRSAPMPEKGPVWYSPVEHALEATTNARATGAQWLATLRNSRGVKPEELDWTGLRAFLEERADRPVTRPELHEYLRDNRVELRDVTKRAQDETALRKQAEEELKSGWGAAEWRRFSRDEREELITEHMDGLRTEFAPEGATKYHHYQLPGGENYREHLITMPGVRDLTAMEGQQLRELERLRGQRNLSQDEQARYWDLAERADRADSAPAQYKSSHWDEPNIVAHVRSNVREMQEPGGFVLRNRNSGNTTRAFKTEQEAADHLLQLPEKLHGSLDIVPSDKPIKKHSLHLEEVQSDWHQAGRRKGYKPQIEQELAELVERRGKLQEEASKLAPSDPRYKEIYQELPKIQSRINEIGSPSGSVPDAPWKKNWHELALRRMIRQAAEEGMDRISWTPGEAQAVRYDLSKQLDKLTWTVDRKGNYNLTGMKDGNHRFSQGSIPEEKLADYIGKEAAEKLVAREKDKERSSRELSSLDLKVGGEGMRGFYDRMMVQAAEKIGREYGVKVKRTGGAPDPKSYRPGDLKIEMSETPQGAETTATDKSGNTYKFFGGLTESQVLANISKKHLSSGPGLDVWYFDIPPAMREAALRKGMPLFSGGKMFVPGGGQTEESK